MFRYISLILFLTYQTVYPLTTLHVTISSDDNPGGIGQVGDLRYCLNSMNESLNISQDDYAIVFDFPMTIQLNGILPIINNSANAVNITIGNPGSISTVTIDGNNVYPGFFIPMGNVTIQNINFQNLTAKGGNGGDGISGGGGGMGAGAAIFAPQFFLQGSYPSIILKNVSVHNCSAIGGNGGSFIGGTSTGNEGGGGGGGFYGNGGSIVVQGATGGAGGGGFGGNGGDVTLSTGDESGYGGGGSGGGGLGSLATIGTITNLGNGGSDQTAGLDGNGYGLAITAGSGGGGNLGGNLAGGGGGGSGNPAGGGGGGSAGSSGYIARGDLPPGGEVSPSGGIGGDGGGGGGGAIVIVDSINGIDGQAGSGGYAGGGGGGAGVGAYDSTHSYAVKGGNGGVGAGGGGGGVDSSGQTSAIGGDSLGGGGGGGAGPSSGLTAVGGVDLGYLGGGAGGAGASSYGEGFAGGGGGGGSGLGAAIFVDSYVNFTIQALSGIPTIFNTVDNTTQAGAGGTGAFDGFAGSAMGNSIFLRASSTLSLVADDLDDILTLGQEVSFVDDTIFGGGQTAVYVRGKGTVIYNGTTDYQGQIMINNANFKVYGQIDRASILVCRNRTISMERGTLSGTGTLTGDVFVNSGTIAPDEGETLTLGSLVLNSANPDYGWVGSLVRTKIVENTTNLVSVIGSASLAGMLEIDIQEDAIPGTYILLNSSGITGTFDLISFIGETPIYTLSYLPVEAPTYVQLDFLGFLQPPSDLQGEQFKNDFGFEYELYNQLTWTASPSSQVVGYIIYRQGEQIATVDASVSMYQDHNQRLGIIVDYSLAAFDAQGNISPLVSLSIPRR